MRIVFAGTPDVAVPSLRYLADETDHDIVGVITRPDAAAGRGRKVNRSPVGQLADEYGLVEVITPRRMSEPEVADTLRRWAPDVGAVVAYGGLVPADLLALPTHGWVNLHFSVLPAWRGAAPVQAAIAAGDEMTGATTFRLEEGLDTGPVYGVLTDSIRPEDTGGIVLDRLAGAGAPLLGSTLDGIATGELAPVAQPDSGVSHAPKLGREDTRVRWELPAHIVDRRIRAFTPTPGCWTTLGEDRIKLGPVTVAVDAAPGAVDTLAPGELAVTKKAVYVGTGSAALRLGTVQPPGKKEMAAADWARGARLTDGTVLR